MSYLPLAYDDADTTATMHRDCDRAAARMDRLDHEVGARARLSLPEMVVAEPPSIRYADNLTEIPKRDIQVDEAAARLASALHLHLD